MASSSTGACGSSLDGPSACGSSLDGPWNGRAGTQLRHDDASARGEGDSHLLCFTSVHESGSTPLRPGQEIEDKKQISFADPEARIMKQKGDFEYAYNAQISVDGKSQVIVGQHVSQQANDSQEVAQALGCGGGDERSVAGEAESGQRLLFGEELARGVGSEGGGVQWQRTGERSGGRGTWTRATVTW